MPEVEKTFIEWFRQSAPYVHSHRGRTFVVSFSGDAVLDGSFQKIVHDLAILHSLGVKLVLVHGARPQIEAALRRSKVPWSFSNGTRVTTLEAMACVKEAVGSVRVELESLLSMSLARTPMAGARIRVASGNFVVGRPVGVIDGIDYGHTGLVRRVDGEAIKERLASEAIVLVSPIGYSATGEAFNLRAQEVAVEVAAAIGADKLVYLTEFGPIRRGRKIVRELSIPEARAIVQNASRKPSKSGRADAREFLECAITACEQGVRRVHLVGRDLDGGMLTELFSRDGVGTLVTGETYEGLRPATLEDVGGIFALIAPLEDQGVLVRRSRELLENEIDKFVVIERDGHLVGCAALYAWPSDRAGELACLAVEPTYREHGRGEQLLGYIEKRAREARLRALFVLTTQTEHWFLERGFEYARPSDLPVKRQRLYNAKRGSKVFVKELDTK